MKLSAFFDKLAGAKRVKPTRKAAEVTEVRVPARPVSRTASITRSVTGIVIIGASFYLGTAYQKVRQSQTSLSTSTNTTSSLKGYDNYGHFYRSSMSTSTVSAISSTSITVKNSSGSSTTYIINGNTFITDNGTQTTASDIQVGDMVVVMPERNDSSIARRIIVNPDFSNGNQPVTINPSQTQLN